MNKNFLLQEEVVVLTTTTRGNQQHRAKHGRTPQMQTQLIIQVDKILDH